MDKKGLSVSINMVVIIILAIMTLVVAIGFITGFFTEIFPRIPQPPELIEEPTRNKPITFSLLPIERGKDRAISIGFYNDEDSTVTGDIVPEISCLNLDELSVSALGLNIPVGEWNTYKPVLSVPRDTPRGIYSCTVTISQTSSAFTLEVR